MDYWQSYELLQGILNGLATMRVQAREKSYSIFDNRYYADQSNAKGVREVSPDARLMTDNNIQLTEFGNRLNHFRNTIHGTFMKSMLAQKTAAIELIKMINSEYNLE